MYAVLMRDLKVYPRVCGGTPPLFSLSSSVSGLSPRLRGNLWVEPYLRLRFRSIPASAGEPRLSERRTARTEVYPRVCGGTYTPENPVSEEEGLSPRLRGNLWHYAG